MKVKVIECNGLLLLVEYKGKQYIDDSKFSEIERFKNGEIVEISEKRFSEMGEVKR